MAPRNTILIGDAAERLRELPDASIDCCITSPPYYALRNYGVEGQIGLEPTVDDWVEALRAVCAEVARVLKPRGSLWLNLADAFSTHTRFGAPPKSLLLGPERLLLALRGDGWIVRGKVVWTKPNPMPSSVKDRLTASHEYVYFLVRERHYYFDLNAIRVPHRSRPRTSSRGSRPLPSDAVGPLADRNLGLGKIRGIGHPLGKNPTDVWVIPPQPYRGAHFATFPEALVERPLLATCPGWTCSRCGQGWNRGLPGCACHADRLPGLALDPFIGTGTVGVVAERFGRDWLGIELNPVYAQLAWQRLRPAAERVARRAA